MSHLRICLINAIAPPAAGSRAERWTFLARELTNRGHRVTVVRADLPDGYPGTDGFLKTILDKHRVEQQVIDSGLVPRLRYNRSSFAPFRLAQRAAAELSWPDYWAGFALNAMEALQGAARDYDIVVTSGQPWSDHLVGYELSRTSGIPWIADYGDPWSVTLSDRGWSSNVNEAPERLMLGLASGVTVTTQPTKDFFIRRFGLDPERVAVIPAGIEADQLPDPPPSSNGFKLVHAGAVYGPRASVRPLLEAAETHRDRANTKLTWYGDLWRGDDKALVERVAHEYAGRVPWQTVREAEIGAHCVVVFGNHGGLQIPAKLWRAAGTGRLVLIVAADDEDPMHAFAGMRGVVVARNDRHSIVEALDRLAATAETWDWRVAEGRLEEHSWTARAVALEEQMDRAMSAADAATGTSARAEAPPGRMIVRRHTWLGTRLAFRLNRKMQNSRIGTAGGTR